MSGIMRLSIDVTKIDKNHFYNGSKGTYLDVLMIPTPNSQYDTHMLKQSVSKEQREAGAEGPIIGSASPLKANAPAEAPATQDGDSPF